MRSDALDVMSGGAGAMPNYMTRLLARPGAYPKRVSTRLEPYSPSPPALRQCASRARRYRMDDQYLERIDLRVEEILAEHASVQLPAWPDDEHEGAYNTRAASLLGCYTIDTKLISTPLHARGGIEPCDIFLPPGVLIHVPCGRISGDLSYLLAQALVSSDSLARDESARAAGPLGHLRSRPAPSPTPASPRSSWQSGSSS